jgi:hypothetical protein
MFQRSPMDNYSTLGRSRFILPLIYIHFRAEYGRPSLNSISILEGDRRVQVCHALA